MKLVHARPVPQWLGFIKQNHAYVWIYESEKDDAYLCLCVNLHRVLCIWPLVLLFQNIMSWCEVVVENIMQCSSFRVSVWGAAEAPLASRGDLLIKHVGLLSAAGGKAEKRRGGCTAQAFRVSTAIIKASDVTSPVARLQWGMSVHCGRKQRGRRLTAKCLCIIHAACKLASCSLLKRNCSEFEIHFLFPHSRAVACKLQVSNGIVPHKPLFHFVSHHL